MYKIAKTFTRSFTNLVFPNSCAVCGVAINKSNNNICELCIAKFPPTGMQNWIDKLRFSEGIDVVFSAWYAQDKLLDIIHNVKYKAQPRLGEELGRKLTNLISVKDIGDIDIITDVPLNNVRKRERGYNQAEWFAKGISIKWGIPTNFKLIKRIKNTATQTDLKSEERFENVKDAFVANGAMKDKSIAIVDDVITTGATISACAIELKKSGVKRVVAISCATPMFGY